MKKDLLEQVKTLIDMEMRSGEGGNISPEYIARSLRVSIDEAIDVLKELGQ